jgi:hypothetical protein
MQNALAKWTMDWNLGSKRTQRLPVGCGRSVRRRWGFVGAAYWTVPPAAAVTCSASQARHRARWPSGLAAGACFAPAWPAHAGPGTAEWQHGRTPCGGRPGGRQARGAVRRAHGATGHCPATVPPGKRPSRIRGCEQRPSAPRLATFRPLVPPSARSDGAFKSTEIHPIPRLVALNVFAATKSCSGRPSSHRRFLRIARASSSCVCRFATFSFLLACAA